MMPVSVKYTWVPTVNGIPQKAFRDPKAAVGWLMDSTGNDYMGCPDLGIVNMDVPKAVQALQDGYHITSRIWAVYRVEVH